LLGDVDRTLYTCYNNVINKVILKNVFVILLNLPVLDGATRVASLEEGCGKTKNKKRVKW